MIIGVPKEIKQDEYRVAMLPVGVEELTRRGHQVLIEQGAGLGSGLADQDYLDNGCEMVAEAQEIFARADMIVKVKEPMPAEWALIRPGTDRLHLLPLRCRSRLDRGYIGNQLHGRGVRNASRRQGASAIADAYERSRRTHEYPGRGQVFGTTTDGTWHLARRGSWSGACVDHGAGWGSSWRERRENCGWISCQCFHP